MAKMRMAVVYREISNLVNSGQIKKHTRFYLVEPERGKKQVLEQSGEGIVRFVDPNAVVDAILSYSVEQQAWEELTHKQAVEAMKYWMGISRAIKLPPYLIERDASGLCFQRLPVSYFEAPKPTPVLDEFISRCSNSEALQLFIGSIFVEDSSRYQYLWLYGPGGEGKGCFGRALARLIGPSATTMVVPKTDSQKQFLAYSLQGKRLCVFPECSNFAFPNDPLFKQLTGHDDVWIEQKGKQGFSAPINSKFIFFSNERAGVSGTDANTRRLIYSEIGKPAVRYSTGTYDALLASEMPSFIIKCRAKYLEACPQGEDIPFDDEITKGLLEFNEERFEVLLEQHLEVGAKLTATPAQMQNLKANAGMTQTEYRNFIEYLRRKVGVESEVVWCKERQKAQKVWRGIKVIIREQSKPQRGNLSVMQ